MVDIKYTKSLWNILLRHCLNNFSGLILIYFHYCYAHTDQYFSGYVYTICLYFFSVNKTLDLLCEVLVMADQLLLMGLKDISEEQIITLSEFSTLKNHWIFNKIIDLQLKKKITMPERIYGIQIQQSL